jgi:hypothetical protein
MERLKPHLGHSLQDYKGAKSTYIGFKMPLEKMILKRIKQNLGISSKMGYKNLPMTKKTFINVLNRLLKSGSIICTSKEDHTPLLGISDIMQGVEPVIGRPGSKMNVRHSRKPMTRWGKDEVLSGFTALGNTLTGPGKGSIRFLRSCGRIIPSSFMGEILPS